MAEATMRTHILMPGVGFTDVARVSYEAYRRESNRLYGNVDTMPGWDTLPPRIQWAWEASVIAVVQQVAEVRVVGAVAKRGEALTVDGGTMMIHDQGTIAPSVLP